MDLKNELPEEKGFSLRNLKLMVQFYQSYREGFTIGQRAVAQLQSGTDLAFGQRAVAQIGSGEIVPQPVAQKHLPSEIVFGLSWAHNIILIQKIKDLPTRYWYARQALEQG